MGNTLVLGPQTIIIPIVVYYNNVVISLVTLLYHKTNQMKCITCYHKGTRLYSYSKEIMLLNFFPLPNLIELRKTKPLLLSCCFSCVIGMFNLAASFLPSRLSFTRLCHSVESDSLKNQDFQTASKLFPLKPNTSLTPVEEPNLGAFNALEMTT